MSTVAKWVVLLWTGYCIYGFGHALIKVLNNLDPFAEISDATSFGMGIETITWSIAWAVIGIPATAIYLVTKKDKDNKASEDN